MSRIPVYPSASAPARAPAPAASRDVCLAARRAFTLIEILGVLLILFVIWGFIFPSVRAVERNAKRRKAAAEVHALAGAIAEYRAEYGVWPMQDVGTSWETDVNYSDNALEDVDCTNLVACLVATSDSSQSSGFRRVNDERNPRHKSFLEPSPGSLRDGVFTDPWGDPYVAVVDGDSDGWVYGEDSRPAEASLSHTEHGKHTVPRVRDSVYVFSWTDTRVASNRVSTVGGH